ncbi:MAG TPA: polyprenyl synthetase family protein, partial [Longimicrobiales bacterium]|nr:polyprenyl synthetase family protein [Longimicrobiales bacterium]
GVPASGEAVDGEGGGAPGSTAVPAAVYDLAASLELIHGYSLVHDDLPCMDDDDMRRGRPATHRAFDTAAAAVAGFALIPLACRAVTQAAGSLGLPERTAAALVRELCAGAGAAGMVGGQVSDLEAEGRRIPLAALISLHRRKTGALLTAALRMGGIAAGAAPEQLAALDTYGRAVGLAFQIADDLLDVEGTAEVLGKTAGRDSDLGKATFPGLLGVDEAHRRARTEVDSALAAIAAAGLSSKELEALARFTVERDR